MIAPVQADARQHTDEYHGPTPIADDRQRAFGDGNPLLVDNSTSPADRSEGGAARHAMLMSASAVIVGILNYALNIVMSWRLPAEQYGQVGVSQTIILICVWFLSAGFPWVVSRAIGRAASAGPLASEEGAAAWRTYKTAWLANVLLALLVVGGLWLLYASGRLPLSPSYGPLIVLVILTVAALGISVVPDAALQGLLRFRRLAGIRITEAVVNTAVSVGLVLLGLGAVGALAGFAVATAITCGLSVWAIRDKGFWQARGWGGLGALADALPITLGVFGGIILTNLDLLAVKFFSAGNSDALTASYQTAAVLSRAPFFVSTALVAAFYPRIARAAVTGGFEETARQLVRWLALLVLPMDVVLVVAAPAVVHFFFPERYASSALLLALLGVSSAMLALATGFTAILQGSGRTAGPALVMTLCALVQIAALWWLVPTLGLPGAALSSLLASGLAYCLLIVLQRRKLDVRLPSLRRYALALAGLALVTLPLGILPDGAGRVMTALWVAGALLFYAAACFFLGLVRAGELPAAKEGEADGALHRLLRGTLVALHKMAETLNRIGDEATGVSPRSGIRTSVDRGPRR